MSVTAEDLVGARVALVFRANLERRVSLSVVVGTVRRDGNRLVLHLDALLGARTPVDTPDGPSFIAGDFGRARLGGWLGRSFLYNRSGSGGWDGVGAAQRGAPARQR